MSDKKHSYYFKPCDFEYVDVYRVLSLFTVTDPCIQHAVKKLLVAGGRGAGKDVNKDIQEAIDSLNRFQEMRAEEERVAAMKLNGAAFDIVTVRDKFTQAATINPVMQQCAAQAGEKF
jgi:hypothetical protein